MAGIVTIVTNTSGSTQFFAYLPPNGATLADGESFTVNGIIDTILAMAVPNVLLQQYLSDFNGGVISVVYDLDLSNIPDHSIDGDLKLTLGFLASLVRTNGVHPFVANQSMGNFNLTNVAPPVVGMDAANKDYVDDTSSSLQAEIDLKVNRSGDTMTGPLFLESDPSSSLQASTKQYVDAGDASLSAEIAVVEASLNARIDDVSSSLQAEIDTKVDRAGDTMTGPLILDADPVVDLEAATKEYVDAGDSSLSADLAGKVDRAGDTMTGPLLLSGGPVVDLEATTKKYVDDAITAAISGGPTPVSPTIDDKQKAVAVPTVGNNVNTGLTITHTPFDNSYVQIFVNGLKVALGDGVTTLDCYFKDPALVGVRPIEQIAAGDILFWNGTIAGYALATTDRIDFDYEVLHESSSSSL